MKSPIVAVFALTLIFGTHSSFAFNTIEHPICVWNQAYQENFAEDKINDILLKAENCYVLIDPFQSQSGRNAIGQLKENGNTVGCYISTGTCEEWRDDFNKIKPYCVDKMWGEWAGEYFVDTPNNQLISLMKARIDKMADWGCDMVEYDNMDWAFYDDNRKTYEISASSKEAIAYNQSLCDYTHKKEMGCMAKNTREGAASFDGGTFESYNNEKDWWEKSHLKGYLDEGKIGVIVHYNETNCENVYDDYRKIYGNNLSYICEDRYLKRNIHYNESTTPIIKKPLTMIHLLLKKK